MTDWLRAAKLHILQHALGLNQYGEGKSYRHHFVTGPGSVDYDNCCALVQDGLMRNAGRGQITGGDDCFIVTSAGVKFVAEYSPKKPRA